MEWKSTYGKVDVRFVYEAAEILGVSVATINRMAANGTLPTAAKLHGRTGAHIFNRATVEAKRVAA